MNLKITKKIVILGVCLSTIVISVVVIIIPLVINDPYKWKVGDPEDYGFDIDTLDETYNTATYFMPYIRSLLVVRHGSMVVEWYFNDGERNVPFHICSVTKTFMSALIGIALNQGILQNLDQKMMDFFPEYEYLDLDPRMYDITLKHLITMEAGFNFSEEEDEWISYALSPDWVEYALSLPLIHNPGEDWHYSTQQANLLSVILTKSANMSTREFAEQNLFKPLGIWPSYWRRDPQGYYTGGHELYFTSRELARFGLLYLNNGSFNNKQILSKEWVQESITDFSNGRVPSGEGYGYLIWIQEMLGYDTFSARGYGGQFVFCVPELDVVVVTTASGNSIPPEIYYPNQYPRLLELIEQNVLASVIPEN
jgi:CubicO group peptidase (beta-lactamase class C family)